MLVPGHITSLLSGTEKWESTVPAGGATETRQGLLSGIERPSASGRRATISSTGPTIRAAHLAGVIREHPHVYLRYVAIAFSTLGHDERPNIGGFLRYDGCIAFDPINQISKHDLMPSDGDRDGLRPPRGAIRTCVTGVTDRGSEPGYLE